MISKPPKSYRFRILGWAIFTCCVLLVPFIAMQFTLNVDWNPSDFVFMGALIFGTGIIFEAVRKKSEDLIYHRAIGVALLAFFLLIWFNGAVGIIGNEDNPANLLYFFVFFIGVAGSFISRFKPRGMANTLFIITIYQFLIPVIALILWPPYNTPWGNAGIYGVFLLNFFFVCLFALSALLFRRAAK